MTNSKVKPCHSNKKRSSHSILSTSKWLVGSSSSNTSGFVTSDLASNTRRLRPPDSDDKSSLGSKPMVVINRVASRSKSQPCTASISCCKVAMRSQASISPSAHRSVCSLYLISKSAVRRLPPITISNMRPLVSGTSCSSIATLTLLLVITSPLSG